MSEPGREVRDLRWALYSKQPQSFDEYEILTDSTAGAQRGELAHAVRELIPGTPATLSRGPDILPWITIGPVDPASGRLGMSIMDYPRDRRTDFAGRTIIETRYFDLRNADLAELEMDYARLWEAVGDATLPLRGPIAVAPRRFSVDVAYVERGREWFLCGAAMVADGQSVVVTGDPPSPPQRLSIIDGIYRLLPWAARLGTTVGTWFPNLDRTHATICFGDVVGRQHTALPLSAGTAPLGPTGQRYLALVRERIGELGLALVVAGLARQLQPWPKERPYTDAVELVAFQQETDLVRGNLTAANTLWALSAFDSETFEICFDPAVQRAIFAHLLGGAEPSEARLFLPYRHLPSFLDSLVAVGLNPARQDAVRAIANQCGLLDKVAKRIATDPGSAVSFLDPLIRRGVDLPETRAVLVDHDVLGPKHLSKALKQGNLIGLTAWIDWLLRGDPVSPWLAPLAAVHRAGAPMARPEALKRLTPATLGALIVLACDLDRVDALLPHGFDVLLRAIQQSATAEKGVRGLPDAGPKAGPSTRAAFDILRALANTPGRGIVKLAEVGELEAYASALAQMVGRLAPGQRGHAVVKIVELLSPSGRVPDRVRSTLESFAAHLGPERELVLTLLT